MEDDWLSVALSDDAVVVELLFLLKHHPSSSSKGLHLTEPFTGWGHHQPRSKPSSIPVNTRCSPTTPLSWSAGTSDESSRPPSFDLSPAAFRSKGTFTCETSNISRRRRRRTKEKRASMEQLTAQHTFTQLKEEEKLLLKVRELASIHVTLNEQRVKSDDLKRIKFDLNPQSSTGESVCNLVEPSRIGPVLSRHTMDEDLAVSSTDDNQNRGFFLPDLNAMPSEDEIN